MIFANLLNGSPSLDDFEMNTLVVAWILMAIAGCATRSVEPVSPLAPYQLAADTLVSLEDACEDPFQDSQTLTSLEAVADMLAMPINMVMWTLRLVAYGTVGLGMALSGKDAKVAIDQINVVLPWSLTGPNPDQVHYHDGMVQESCLVAKM